MKKKSSERMFMTLISFENRFFSEKFRIYLKTYSVVLDFKNVTVLWRIFFFKLQSLWKKDYKGATFTITFSLSACMKKYKWLNNCMINKNRNYFFLLKSDLKHWKADQQSYQYSESLTQWHCIWSHLSAVVIIATIRGRYFLYTCLKTCLSRS